MSLSRPSLSPSALPDAAPASLADNGGDDTARRTQWPVLLLEVTRLLLEDGHDDAALTRLMFEKIAPHLEADVCFNYRLDAKSGTLRLVAGPGIAPEFREGAQSLQLGQAFCGTVAATCLPLTADAARIGSDEKGAFVRAMGVRAYACHPLLGSDGQVLGTLSLASTRRERFTEEEIGFLQTLCHFISLAWQRHRAEEERSEVERKLHEREARFRGIFDSTFQFIGLLAPDGTLLEANRAALEFGGFPAEAVIGRPFWEARWWAEAPDAATPGRLRAAIAEAAGGHFVRYDVEVRGAGQETALIDFSLRPVRDPHGAVVMLVPEGRDITEMKRGHAALEASEERLRLAVEGAGMATWDVVLATGEATWSASHFAMLGYAPHPQGKATYAMWRDRIHPDDRARILEMADRCTQDGAPYAVEYRIARADTGEERWLSAFGTQTEQPDGPHFVGVLFDDTERRQAEAALRESEARFRTLADTMPQMVWATQPDGFHDYYNARWYEFTGVPEGSTDGEAWNGMFHPDDQERAWARWRHSLATGESYEIEYRLRRHDGMYRWTLGRALPLRDEASRITRWFGTCTDIHDAKEAGEVVARSRVELERLVEDRTAELMRAAEERHRAEDALRQGEKLQAIGQLTGGIAHDFNNMLQVVASGVTLLRMPTVSPERKAMLLDGIAQAAQNAKELTGQLLSFARQQSLKPETFDLGERLGTMVELLRHSLGSPVQIEADFAPGLWPVTLDLNQLETAILNLGVNARDAMPEGGTLSITARNCCHTGPSGTEEPHVCLTLRDTGEGMTPEVQARVFEPFFTTKPLGKGTGLGLAQVHGFIKQSGGDIQIESQVGQGTAIHLLLLPHAADAAPVAAGASAERASAHRPAGHTVLVVDDNPEVVSFVTTLLGEQGYSIRQARSAAEALALLASGERVDAVFSDIVMPGEMDGFGLAEAIRRDYPGIAVVLATGYSEQLARGRAFHPTEVLAKPFRSEELSEALARAFVAVASPHQEAAYE